MLALGAKLVEASQTQRTATEADYDNISETSILSSTASNVGAAFTWGLQFASQFVGAKDETIEYDLNTEFDLVNLTPDERRQLISEWQSGAITFEEMRDNLRRGGIATLTDAAAKSKIAAEGAERLANEVAQATALDGSNGRTARARGLMPSLLDLTLRRQIYVEGLKFGRALDAHAAIVAAEQRTSQSACASRLQTLGRSNATEACAS
jgi:hypothetical protein